MEQVAKQLARSATRPPPNIPDQLGTQIIFSPLDIAILRIEPSEVNFFVTPDDALTHSGIDWKFQFQVDRAAFSASMATCLFVASLMIA